MPSAGDPDLSLWAPAARASSAWSSPSLQLQVFAAQTPGKGRLEQSPAPLQDAGGQSPRAAPEGGTVPAEPAAPPRLSPQKAPVGVPAPGGHLAIPSALPPPLPRPTPGRGDRIGQETGGADREVLLVSPIPYILPLVWSGPLSGCWDPFPAPCPAPWWHRPLSRQEGETRAARERRPLAFLLISVQRDLRPASRL